MSEFYGEPELNSKVLPNVTFKTRVRTNEDLYSQIQELRNRIEKIENVLFKLKNNSS